MKTGIRRNGYLCSPSRIIIAFFLTFVVVIYLTFPYEPTALRQVPYNIESQPKEHIEAAANSLPPIDTSSVSQIPESGNVLEIASQEGISPKRKPKVAIAITVTKDGNFVDGALVLGYSAKKYHSLEKGYPSAYEIELVAFVIPSVVTSREVLQRHGWRIIERRLPVEIDDIENKEYAESMRNSGCCGADEFLKLWAYTLTEYYRVVHLDMDSIIFKNLDIIFNTNYELLFTGDYNMMGGSPVPPAQGGFLVIRPSMERFEEFRAIIRKGDHGGKGWGGSRIGNFWGGQTIQGIVPYFYHVLHNGDAKELNRCEFNCMVDNPYHKNTLKCLDRQPTCQDCRAQNPDLVYSAHFTICQKPWTCSEHTNPRNKVLCEVFHDKWFVLRDELEKDLGIDPSYRAKVTRYKKSFGMCRGYGDDKYITIPQSSL